ncbi:MAG TPA: carbohydrate ABC transporter permease [Chloroflexota bacterium]|jgi:multiple sugar transport system permease protein|nr:carbohydrate ABC transporter permease [Chloroflexota bacterium]
MTFRRALAYLGLLLGSVVMLVPFLWMISTSLKADREVFAYPPIWVPAEILWSNYPRVLELLPFRRYLINTTFVAATVTVLEVVTSSLAAYAFARLSFPGRDKLFLLYLGTLMVPGQVTIIPNFLLMSWLGWTNSYLALIIPAAFTAFGTFLLRQFFLSIPVELEQAARIDGCSYFGIYRHIILPLSGPALATLAIFAFMSQWNAFLWPLIVTHSDNYRTLTVGLSYFRDEFATQFNYLMAGTVMNVIPVLCVFAVLQRYFVRGIALTGITGR